MSAGGRGPGAGSSCDHESLSGSSTEIADKVGAVVDFFVHYPLVKVGGSGQKKKNSTTPSTTSMIEMERGERRGVL